MNELKMRRMKSNAGNSPLRRFRQVVFSVADDRVADRRKLHPDLILQPRRQRHPDQRSAPERAFDAISKFRASRFGVALRAQRLKHSFTSKVVNERPFLGAGTPANNREILPDGSMGEKLPDECIAIRFSFRKEQNPGRKTIDAMHHQSSLSLQFEFCGEKRPSGWGIGALDRHSRKSGRLIEDHHGIVFVKHEKLP
ncbi:MAG: hypothetical protein WBL65_04275 [Bryobacteraceae bacterium]